ncbi:hypothetical protein FCM35_KLT13197 [Carex littledalei]|uniref:Uncharacterized protein n=1 Tax=Carex littledalei TaxID=544730 RepID=A0A833QLQ0_9POAL|nr:hypothetical protein FCM35_KLT13197 [Carex littledalei]
METESNYSPTKHRRYDLSMSKRTRKPNIAMVAADNNPGKDGGLLVSTPVTSIEKKEGVQLQQVLDYTSVKVLVSKKEIVFAPATPRPSLKELIQVTNKEERDAREVTEEDLVSKKVCVREKEDKLLTGAVRQQQIVTGVKPVPGMVQRCTKALNQMIKVRYAPKQKNAVALIGM